MVTTDGNWQWNKPLVIVLGLVLAGLIFVLGVAAGHATERFRAFGPMGGGMRHQRLLGGGMKMGTARLGQADNGSRIQGVVTAVNGTNLTVSGGGATNTVTTNGSTQYTNGTKAAVNDSLLVFGTVNNGSFTAERIVINP